MRIHRGVCMLATAAIIASSAPSAGAQAISSGNGGGNASVPAAAASQPAADSSTDWGLIGVSAAGGAILTAAGMTASRRYGHVTHRRSTATLS